MCYKLKKPYERFERADFICAHKGLLVVETDEYTIALESNEIMQDGEVIINPNYETEQLEHAKQNKIIQNDTIRDTVLLQGVTYNNVLFDSDTDQKVNLLATINMISDEDTVFWYGMDNQPLECSKTDLIAIGNLIVQLHSFCWSKTALLKTQIEQAETLEELNNIEINYEFIEE